MIIADSFNNFLTETNKVRLILMNTVFGQECQSKLAGEELYKNLLRYGQRGEINHYYNIVLSPH